MTPEERELRVKYVDWCSARVAEHLLELSPEEAFDIAEWASRYRQDPSSFERELLGFRLDPPSQSEKG